MSVLGRSHRYAIERAGLTNSDLRSLASDEGVTITDVEAAADWLSPEPDHTASGHRARYTTDQLLAIAAELGATTLVLIHEGDPAPANLAAERFAAVCDRAADEGLRVALEYPAWMTIGSLEVAWEVVRTADRPNGGLLVDLWHHRRSNSDDELLRTIPPERIYSVQLSDATAQPRGTLVEDVMHRALPGDGEFDVAAFVALLADIGVEAPIGIEVLEPELLALGPDAAARALYDALQVTMTSAAALDTNDAS
jgi:sugar phosphate isomerase/epimerase